MPIEPSQSWNWCESPETANNQRTLDIGGELSRGSGPFDRIATEAGPPGFDLSGDRIDFAGLSTPSPQLEVSHIGYFNIDSDELRTLGAINESFLRSTAHEHDIRFQEKSFSELFETKTSFSLSDSLFNYVSVSNSEVSVSPLFFSPIGLVGRYGLQSYEFDVGVEVSASVPGFGVGTNYFITSKNALDTSAWAHVGPINVSITVRSRDENFARYERYVRSSAIYNLLGGAPSMVPGFAW